MKGNSQPYGAGYPAMATTILIVQFLGTTGELTGVNVQYDLEKEVCESKMTAAVAAGHRAWCTEERPLDKDLFILHQET